MKKFLISALKPARAIFVIVWLVGSLYCLWDIRTQLGQISHQLTVKLPNSRLSKMPTIASQIIAIQSELSSIEYSVSSLESSISSIEWDVGQISTIGVTIDR